MNGIITRNLNRINSIKNAIRYSTSLLLTNGRKVCTELAKSMARSHDAVQRDLNSVAKYPEEVEANLLSNVLQKNRKSLGYLIVDSTLLVKEHSKKIEGVSRQHSGSEEKPGIGLTAIAWTDLVNTEPVALSMWKKGDISKVKTATELVISLAQRINVQAILADGAFATIESIEKYVQASVSFVMRFHSNRVVTVLGFNEKAQVKEHPAFKFKKNQRRIVRQILWHDIKLCVIALKIKHKAKGWITIFLVTNMSLRKAFQVAELYKHRWKIETFFRTCKQRFGLGQCQARSLRQQKAHCLSVFLAYSRMQKISILRSDHKTPNVSDKQNDDLIRSLMFYA